MRFWIRQIRWLFLLISIFVFVERSLLPPGRFWDFPILYTSSRAWLLGLDPYALKSILPLWPPESVSYVLYTPDAFLAVATPASLIALAPVAWMTPASAIVVWAVVTVLLTVAMIAGACWLAELHWKDGVAPWLVGWIMLLPPLQIGLLAGQPSAAAGPLLVLGALAAARNRQVAAGVCFAIASCFKLQLGLPFLLLYFFLGGRRWVAAYGLALLCALCGIVLFKLQLDHTAWLQSWIANLRACGEAGGMNDFGLQNPERFHMLNLQLLLAGFIRNRTIVSVLGVAIGLVLSIFLFLRIREPRRSPPNALAPMGASSDSLDVLRCLATAAPLCLLPVYHRYYDAVVLIFTMTWVVREFAAAPRAQPLLAGLIICVCFLTPMSIAPRLADHVPPSAEVAVRLLIIPFRVWGLLALTLLLLLDPTPWHRRPARSAHRENQMMAVP